MRWIKGTIMAIFFLGLTTCLRAQAAESPLRIFGYFQNSFVHQSRNLVDVTGTLANGRNVDTTVVGAPAQNSFNLQQLNLFFQKNLAKDWRAFINFEVLNSFSSSRQWGAFNLEEAWIRYESSEKFSFKMGLLLPIFNHLNEIKNRTPLLPYVIRPLVYETSFSEFIAVEEFTPARAFLQASGFLPLNRAKLDYAVYLGNSPNVNNNSDRGQTGVDTTDTILLGGRIGVRFDELKVGVSATRDNVNVFQGVEAIIQQEVPLSRFIEVVRTRLGADLSYRLGRLFFEGEFIHVRHEDKAPQISLDKEFYYGTLGYSFTDELLAYGSYWLTRQDFTVLASEEPPALGLVDVDIKVPNVGLAFNLNDRVTFKGQYARVQQKVNDRFLTLLQKSDWNFYSIAASVFF